MGLFSGGENPLVGVVRGNRELPHYADAVTAREALSLIYPTVLEVSRTPVLLIVTSGTDVTADGRARTWEFVFHFPARRAQGVYSLVPANMDRPGRALRLDFRLSPRPDADAGPGLPLDFVDSPAAAHALTLAGVDWTSGDPDMTLATKRLGSGEVVWATEAYGRMFTTPFRVLR